MNLLEFEAKQVFSGYGIPIPKGEVVTSANEASEAAGKIGKAVVLKAQVPVGGRGKAGGILVVNSADEAGGAALTLLDREIRGFRVRKLLVEERLDIQRELYVGVSLDRSAKCYVLIASAKGGINIEEVAATSPGDVIKYHIDPILELRSYHVRPVAKSLGFRGGQLIDLTRIMLTLCRIARERDADMAEINPLIETVKGDFLAADGRLSVDDNSLYRQPLFNDRLYAEERGELSADELEAKKKGISYVMLPGNIGVISNGAGLTMATVDLIKLKGGEAADFLDLGGGASEEQILGAFRVVLSNPRVRVVLINILGGITRCDEIARAIVEVKRSLSFRKPMFVRLTGTNEQVGKTVLEESGIEVSDDMEDAVMKAVEAAGRN